jgi:hypothetical protein
MSDAQKTKLKIHGTNANPMPFARKTVLSYGETRSGKTRFASTWPRPEFLSDATESGWTTIENMDTDAFYDEDRLPEIYPIHEAIDVTQHLGALKPRIASGEIMTLVFDSLTFYNDSYFNYIYKMAPPGKVDSRDLYGKLAKHLMDIRIQVHSLPCNVLWLCLAKSPDEQNSNGRPMITGQSQDKFPAGCDFIFYHKQIVKSGHDNQWEIRTRKHGSYIAGGRDEGRLPDPLPEPTYRSFAECLDLEDPIKRFAESTKAVAAVQRRPAPVSTTVRR